MKLTDHFREEVVGSYRRPGREGITYELCIRIVRDACYSNEQGGQSVFWGYAEELPGNTRWLRVVTDHQRQVLIAAHKDRDFQRERGRERG